MKRINPILFAFFFILHVGHQALAKDFSLHSPALAPSGNFSAIHTCEGADISPALTWSTPPEGTQSFALILDDTDAPSGTFNHWVMYNIPPELSSLGENASKHPPKGVRQGINSFGHLGYNGPCPPPGETHRYIFKLYALDMKLDKRLKPEESLTREELIPLIQNHIIGQARIGGRFFR